MTDVRTGLPGLWSQSRISWWPRCVFWNPLLHVPWSHLPMGGSLLSATGILRQDHSWEMEYPSDKHFWPNGLPKLSLELHCSPKCFHENPLLPSFLFHSSQTCVMVQWFTHPIPDPTSFSLTRFDNKFLAYLIPFGHLLLQGSRFVHRLLAKKVVTNRVNVSSLRSGLYPSWTQCGTSTFLILWSSYLFCSNITQAVTGDTFFTLLGLLSCILKGWDGPHSFHLGHEFVPDKKKHHK